MNGSDREWLDEADCRTTDPEVFFPDLDHTATINAARKICRRCPVHQQCAEWALARRQTDGIHAGIRLPGIGQCDDAYRQLRTIARTGQRTTPTPTRAPARIRSRPAHGPDNTTPSAEDTTILPDICARVVAGHTHRDIATQLRIPMRAVTRLVRLAESTGELETAMRHALHTNPRRAAGPVTARQRYRYTAVTETIDTPTVSPLQ